MFLVRTLRNACCDGRDAGCCAGCCGRECIVVVVVVVVAALLMLDIAVIHVAVGAS